jgi:hypothetical protein
MAVMFVGVALVSWPQAGGDPSNDSQKRLDPDQQKEPSTAC